LINTSCKARISAQTLTTATTNGKHGIDLVDGRSSVQHGRGSRRKGKLLLLIGQNHSPHGLLGQIGKANCARIAELGITLESDKTEEIPIHWSKIIELVEEFSPGREEP
jgi:hypothetical protein